MIFKRNRPKQLEVNHIEDLELLMEDGKPILIDFFQHGCGPCKVMDGIVNELAEEFVGGAHIVKVNVGRVPSIVQLFKIRSTPTFVVLGRSQKKISKKKHGGARSPQPMPSSVSPTPRWRTSGVIRKDQLIRILESNGGVRNQG